MTDKNEVDEFNRNINISYVDESLPEPDNKLITKHYICSVLVYTFIYCFLGTNPFFSQNFLKLNFYFGIFIILYIILAPFILFTVRPKSVYRSHNIDICNYIIKVYRNIFFPKQPNYKDSYKDILDKFKMTYYEKQSFMLIFIKVFFGALMVFSVYHNLCIFPDFLEKIQNSFINITFDDMHEILRNVFNYILENEPLLMSFSMLILYTIDLAVFSFGYLTELSILNNKIRSVETTPLGIFFCLLCYPPFFSTVNSFLGNNIHSEKLYAEGDVLPIIRIMFHITALFFITIYVAASVAMGTKASNLTNRGTVSKFPYNIVRHPAYICKNLFWIISVMPLLIVNFNSPEFDVYEYVNFIAFFLFSSIFFLIVYYMRAITEERHLMQDPEYREYTKKVKYRFIPGVI